MKIKLSSGVRNQNSGQFGGVKGVWDGKGAEGEFLDADDVLLLDRDFFSWWYLSEPYPCDYAPLRIVYMSDVRIKEKTCRYSTQKTLIVSPFDLNCNSDLTFGRIINVKFIINLFHTRIP